MRIASYDLTVYCDGNAHQWGQPYVNSYGDAHITGVGRNETQAKQEVRRAGWKLGKFDLCPACVAAKERPTRHWGEEAPSGNA